MLTQVKDDIKPDVFYKVGQQNNGFRLNTVSWKYTANSSTIQPTARDSHLVVLEKSPPVATSITVTLNYQVIGGPPTPVTISAVIVTSLPQPSDLKAVLPLGKVFTLLQTKANTIQVLGLDPDDLDAPETAISYAWTCVFPDSSPCVLSSGAAFPLPSSSSRSFVVGASQAVLSTVHKITVVMSKPGKTPLTIQLTVDFGKLAVLPIAIDSWGLSGQKTGWIREDGIYMLQACSDGKIGTISDCASSRLGTKITTRAFSDGRLLQTTYAWTTSGAKELEGLSLGSKRSAVIPSIYNRTLSGTLQLCVSASNALDGLSKQSCMNLIPHKAVSLDIKLSNERVVDGADLDPATALKVSLQNFMNGGQATGIDSRLGVYQFAFGFCTHFRKNECQGAHVFQEWSLQESATLALPFIKLSKGYSVAVAVKVRDSTSTEQFFYKKILVRYPRTNPEEFSTKLDKNNPSSYFYSLTTMMFSFPGASIQQSCQELLTLAKTTLPNLKGRESLQSLLTSIVLCLHKANLTAETKSAIEELSSSIWDSKDPSTINPQSASFRRTLEVHDFRDFDKVVVGKSIALLLYQANYLLGNHGNQPVSQEQKGALLALIAPHIKSGQVVRTSLETFGLIGRLYYHLEPQSLMETNLIVKDLYPSGFSTSKLDFLDALNYTQWDSSAMLDGEFLVVYESYYLPRSRLLVGNKTTAVLNSSVYASFQIYNSSLQAMTLNNLTNSFSILLPTDSLDLLRQTGWTEVCQRATTDAKNTTWSLHGTSDLYIVDKLTQESVPACSSDVFGDFKLITDSQFGVSLKSPSLKQLFYLYWPVYAEMVFIVGCLMVFASIYLREKNGLHKKSDYLRSLNRSLGAFDIRSLQAAIETKSLSHQRLYQSFNELLSEENRKLYQIYSKLDSIATKKTKIVYKNAGAELEEIERQKMEKLRLEHGLDSEGEEIGADDDGADRPKFEVEEGEPENENATFFDYKAKKGRDLKEEIGTQFKQSQIDKANRQFISYKSVDENSSDSPKKSKLKGFVMGKKKLEVKSNANQAALLFTKKQYYKKGIDSIDEEPEQEDDVPGTVEAYLKPNPFAAGTKMDSVSTIGGPEVASPTRSDQTFVVTADSHQGSQEPKISKFVVPSEQKKPAAPVSLVDAKKVAKSGKPSEGVLEKPAGHTTMSFPSDIAYHVNREGSLKSEFVSFTDIFLISHRLTGIFMFKDPFNLTALRFMLTFNLMLCMFVLCGAISLYTIDTFSEPVA